MIALVTFKDEKGEAVVSHGIDLYNDKIVILPQSPLWTFRDAVFHPRLGAHVIFEDYDNSLDNHQSL